jgi:hypothetical protein
MVPVKLLMGLFLYLATQKDHGRSPRGTHTQNQYYLTLDYIHPSKIHKRLIKWIPKTVRIFTHMQITHSQM